MWRIVHLLMKDRFFWANGLIKLNALSRDYEVNGEMVAGRNVDEVIIESTVSYDVMHYNKEIRVNRIALCNAYIIKYYPKLNLSKKAGGVNFDVLDRNFQKAQLEAQSIINSCITHTPQYIQTEDNNKIIFLTVEGKKFAGIDGLIKAEIREMGVIWTTASAIVGAFFGWYHAPIIHYFYCLFFTKC